MPAILGQDDVHLLQAREWQNTVGQSGMTPTAFSFLIPVFVVAIVAPFLCIFCIRKRRQPIPITTRPILKVKKPALRRAEAREKLKEITQISSQVSNATEEDGGRPEVESGSVLERECAICLSALYAPSPPEPAKLSSASSISDAAAALPPSLPSTTDQAQSTDTATATTATAITSQPEPETILKLSICGHEFHAECLVSWFILRKTSCPICRSIYMSKEDMDKYDEEEQIAIEGTPVVTPTVDSEAQPPAPVVVRNWRYFLYGRDAYRLARERQARQQAEAQAQSQPAVEMQNRSANGGAESEQQSETESGAVAAAATEQQEQSPRSRWRRFFTRH